MTIAELLPAVESLSPADKFRLMQIVLAQLAQEEGITAQPSNPADDSFDPRRYFGAG